MSRFRLAGLIAFALLLALTGCQAVPITLTPAPTAAPAAPAIKAAAPTGLQPAAGPGTAQAVTVFSSSRFGAPLVFVLESDWSVEGDQLDELTLRHHGDGYEFSFDVLNDAQLFDPATGKKIPFPQDFPTWLQNDPDFAEVKAQPVTVAGIDGLQIDATPVWRSTTAHIKRFLAVTSANIWNLVNSPEKWRFILLDDVNGQRVLILMIASPDKFDATMQEVRPILDKLTIGRAAAAPAQ